MTTGSRMRGPWEPSPTTIGGITDGRYVPVCPVCRGAVRRNLSATTGRERERGITGRYDWRCDLHGPVAPAWEAVD